MGRELLLGAGNDRTRLIPLYDRRTWDDLITCDLDPNCGADVLCDLNRTPWPFADESFAEVHAYEVLEHLGTQGDWRGFFDCFAEVWRILEPDGLLAATCPSWQSIWAWGDPSHTRVINSGTLAFLLPDEYRRQIGVTPMTDFRHYWRHGFKAMHIREDESKLAFVLRKEPDG